MALYGPNRQTSFGVVIDAGALSGSPDTGEIQVGGYKTLCLGIEFTHDTATEVTMTMEVAYPSNPTTFYANQEVDESGAPILVSTDKVWTKTVSGDAEWTWELPVDCTLAKCTFSGSGLGTDSITVTAIADAG